MCKTFDLESVGLIREPSLFHGMLNVNVTDVACPNRMTLFAKSLDNRLPEKGTKDDMHTKNFYTTKL